MESETKMKRKIVSELGLMVYICNPALRRPNLKDHEFQVSLGYKVVYKVGLHNYILLI